MNPLTSLRSLGRRLFRRAKIDAELEEELRTHLQLRVDDLIRSGLDPTRAGRQAAIEFGGTERCKEECRDALGGSFLDSLCQDLRFSCRLLRKSPGFSAVVIITIALGVAATTAIFGVVDATLLRPLPFPHPEQLVRIEDNLPGVGARDVGMSEPEWQDLQHSGIFEYVSPAWYDDNNLTGPEKPARVSLLIVAPSYFAILGKQPELGRTFPPQDHSPGFTTEAVISHSLWQKTFGGDPHILGRSFRLDTDLYQIVGVMPPDLRDPGGTGRDKNIEVWAATSFYGAPLQDHPSRSGRNLPTAIARLSGGLTTASAQAKVDALVASLQEHYAGDYPAQNRWNIRLVPLQESIVGNVRQPLLLLLVGMVTVLLIVCVNVANLLLARATARTREMAIRQALGAKRARLIQQLLSESILLAGLGGAGGVLILFYTKDFLLRLVPDTLPRLNDFSINWTSLLAALLISLLCGLIFGLAPALQASRLDLVHPLKLEGRGTSAAGERARARGLLVISQFALSLVLMIAAGLLLHSFWDLLNARLGFDPEKIISIKTRLPYPNVASADHYKTAVEQTPFFQEMIRRSCALPGVEEAAMGDLGSLPLGHDRSNQTPPLPMMREGHERDSSEAPLVDESIVSPEYFHLMRISLRQGRLLTGFDNDKAEPVAVINQAMADSYWPNENPIGRRAKLTRRSASWMTIVGIVDNARSESLEDATVPQIYTSLYQRGARHLVIFLRGHLDTATISGAVRDEVQSLDPTLPVFQAQTLNETVSASLAQRRLSLELVAAFALTALLLAALGIYGVISYLVTERTHEIGIRLALGAPRGSILKIVLGQGLRLALIGAAAGLACAFAVAQLMASLLYGVKPHDPIVFIATPLILFAVAIFAAYLPARRAADLDPIIALRES